MSLTDVRLLRVRLIFGDAKLPSLAGGLELLNEERVRLLFESHTCHELAIRTTAEMLSRDVGISFRSIASERDHAALCRSTSSH